MLRDDKESGADKSYLAFKQYQVPIIDYNVKSAMKSRLRSKAKKENISYADAIGYTIAERLEAIYLTGDDAFERLPDMEFVK